MKQEKAEPRASEAFSGNYYIQIIDKKIRLTLVEKVTN